MPSSSEIGIKVVPMQSDNRARTLLNEIATLLQRLLESGEPGSIELSALPLGDDDYALLDEVLGEGSTAAHVEGEGTTEIAQSGIPGIWWVTQYDEQDEIAAQFIEVAICPEALLVTGDDIQGGIHALRARLLEEHLITRGE